MSYPTSTVGRAFEHLETRAVPAALSAMLTASGILRVYGTEAADDITVRQVDGQLIVDDALIATADGEVASIPVDSTRKVAIFGGGGDDIIFLATPDEEVTLKTKVEAGDGHDWVYGGVAADLLIGGLGNDSLFGGAGRDEIQGKAGDDFLDDGDRNRKELVSGGKGFDWNADIVAVGGTRPKDVRQQDSPTCSFLASLQGLSGIGYDFREWISYDGVGENGVPTYSVAFFDGDDWVWQSVEFDGTLDMTDPAPAVEGESWVALMNRAWIAYRGDDGTAFPHEAILALAGDPATHADYTEEVMPTSEINVIVATLNAGGIVVAGTGPEEFLATETLIAEHAYTVEDVLTYEGEVWLVLRNPMGVDGGAVQTGNVFDGLLYVSWSEFRESVTYLAAF